MLQFYLRSSRTPLKIVTRLNSLTKSLLQYTTGTHDLHLSTTYRKVFRLKYIWSWDDHENLRCLSSQEWLGHAWWYLLTCVVVRVGSGYLRESWIGLWSAVMTLHSSVRAGGLCDVAEFGELLGNVFGAGCLGCRGLSCVWCLLVLRFGCVVVRDELSGLYICVRTPLQVFWWYVDVR